MWQQNYTPWATACRYNVTLESGKFEASIAHLPDDRRLQVLLIAFAFGAFIEGAAGFATPVAATRLTVLGCTPLYAAAICLLANAAPVAFGSIPGVTATVVTGLPVDRLSAGVGRICTPISQLHAEAQPDTHLGPSARWAYIAPFWAP